MSQPPNIILVTIDSLRADYVHGDRADTPAIDSLAADGTAIPNAIAQGPFTTFSMPSLFTGQYPSSLPSIDFVDGVEGVLVEGGVTLQERLSEVGYTTAGFHSNPLLSEMFGFHVGFDHFYDSLNSSLSVSSERFQILIDKVRRLLRTTAYVPAADITERALSWLEKNDAEPFFLWVHYMDVHGPYQPKSGFTYFEKYRSEWLWQKAIQRPAEVTTRERLRLREAYVDEVEYTDESIGHLLNGLQNGGYYDDAFIALTADHGDEFAEHGSYSHESKLYDELIRVPLIVKPSEGTTIRRAPSQIPLLDVSASVVDVGGAATVGLDGTSLLADADEAGTETHVISEAKLSPQYIGSIRTNDWKYIRGTTEEELYDLEADPGETKNVAEAESDILSDLSARLSTHLDQSAIGEDRSGELLDTGKLDDRLRSLGYLE